MSEDVTTREERGGGGRPSIAVLSHCSLLIISLCLIRVCINALLHTEGHTYCIVSERKALPEATAKLIILGK